MSFDHVEILWCLIFILVPIYLLKNNLISKSYFYIQFISIILLCLFLAKPHINQSSESFDESLSLESWLSEAGAGSPPHAMDPRSLSPGGCGIDTCRMQRMVSDSRHHVTTLSESRVRVRVGGHCCVSQKGFTL